MYEADTPVGITADVDDHDEGGVGRLIRPYAITGGRTGAESEISLETQIQATDRGTQQAGAYRWEAAKVVELVQSPIALIELAARAEVPIGVARVLVSDLMDDGAVRLYVPQRTQNYTSLLERVLDGVRNL